MGNSGYETRRIQQQTGPDKAAPEVQQPDQQLEQVEEGQELSTETASRVGAQLGNAALANILNNKAGQGAEVETAAQEQEEQVEEIVEVDEDLDMDLDFEGPAFGGGGGGAGVPGAPNDGGGGGGANPWDVGKLFGGDDDDDDPNAPTRSGRLAPSPRRTLQSPDEDGEGGEAEADPAQLSADELSPIDWALLGTPVRPDELREGDAVYLAVEAALQDPLSLGRHAVDPEALVDRAGVLDPINRPTEIGRFLAVAAEHRRARGLGRALGLATATLSPACGGFSGAAARLANLAVCAEALEGGGERTDRAVGLALAFDAWPAAVEVARPMAGRGSLHAPLIFDALLGEPPPENARHPDPSVLGGRALQRIVPEVYLPVVPTIDLDSADPILDDNVEMDEFDAILAEYTGGSADAEAAALVAAEVVAPATHAARYLMNAVGRAHVELAAAAYAVWLVRPEAPVRGALVTADRALVQLARGVLRAGRVLERLPGTPREDVDFDALEGALRGLMSAREGVVDLRDWAFSTIAGAMDAELRPAGG